MNVIDALTITLGLDPSGYLKGQKDATAAQAKLSKDMVDSASKAEKAQNESLALIVKGLQTLGATQKKTADESVKHSKSMSSATEGVAQSGEKALRTFGALFLLVAGGHSIKSFVTDMLNLDAATGRAAKNMGQTPEALSGIGRAVERMGGTFGGAVGGLRGLSDAFEQMRTTGNSAIMEPLARLQGLSGQAIKFGKDVHANYLSIADALHTLNTRDPAMADFLGRQIFGDEGLTNLAKGGSGAVKAAEAAAPKITKEQADQAQKLQEQLAAVRQGFQDIGNSILMSFGPAMLKGITWVQNLVEANRGLIESKVSEWVKDVGTWFQNHRSDVEGFGKAVGDLATAAGSLATAFASQSPTMQALELFAATMGGKVLGAITSVAGALGALGKLPVPSALAFLMNPAVLGTAAVGAVLASGDPNKALLSGGRPDLQPQDNDLGLPGIGEDRKTDTSDVKAKVEQVGGLWDRFKKAIGWGDRLHDDTKTKDDISDTAKGVKEIRDLVKDGASLTGSITGVTASSGGLGGSGRHVDGGSSPGASLRDHAGPSRPAKGALAANQKEAYAAALKEGLSPTAARALVANMSGEGLAVPGDYHWDSTHMASGIVQWDPTRSARIKGQFGAMPHQLSVADQTRAVIWEMKTRPEYAATWRALQGSDPNAMIDALVRNYENPRDKNGAISTRLGYLKGFNPSAPSPSTTSTPTAIAPVPAGTSEKAVTDAEVFAARQRTINGGENARDRAIIQTYGREQTQHVGAHGETLPEGRAPKGSPPTVDHLVRHVLSAIHKAQRLTHREDGKPVPVTMGDKTADHIGKRTFGAWRDYVLKHQGEMPHAHAHAAALASMTRLASTGGYSIAHHNVSNSDTRINGGIHVHTAATDAQGIAADIEPHLHRGQAAGRADYGLA